jgi:hypothetical protein
MARFPSVFRSEPLERSANQNPVLGQNGSSTDKGSPVGKSRIPPAAADIELPLQVPAVAVNAPLQKAPLALKTSAAAVSSTWASAVVGNGTTEKNITVTRHKKPAVIRFILYNYEGYRVDTTLPPPTSNDVHNLHALMGQGKLCNEYFLKGKCTMTQCKYLHTGKLTAGELNALKHKARKLSCTKKIGCDDYGCYCGHVCPYERNSKCSKEGCHFEDVHGIDRVSCCIRSS